MKNIFLLLIFLTCSINSYSSDWIKMETFYVDEGSLKLWEQAERKFDDLGRVKEVYSSDYSVFKFFYIDETEIYETVERGKYFNGKYEFREKIIFNLDSNERIDNIKWLDESEELSVEIDLTYKNDKLIEYIHLDHSDLQNSKYSKSFKSVNQYDDTLLMKKEDYYFTDKWELYKTHKYKYNESDQILMYETVIFNNEDTSKWEEYQIESYKYNLKGHLERYEYIIYNDDDTTHNWDEYEYYDDMKLKSKKEFKYGYVRKSQYYYNSNNQLETKVYSSGSSITMTKYGYTDDQITLQENYNQVPKGWEITSRYICEYEDSLLIKFEYFIFKHDSVREGTRNYYYNYSSDSLEYEEIEMHYSEGEFIRGEKKVFKYNEKRELLEEANYVTWDGSTWEFHYSAFEFQNESVMKFPVANSKLIDTIWNRNFILETYFTGELYGGGKLKVYYDNDLDVEEAQDQQKSLAFPNPFTESTVIQYSVETPSQVKLELYDLAGRMVKHIDNGIEIPGEQSIEINGTDLISGRYFYKLYIGNEVQSGSVVLNK